jgi:DNA-nicking Smr family endonuclease
VSRSRDQERALWQAAMRDVKPLKRAKAPPSPAAAERPRAAAVKSKLRRGRLPIEGRLDLHGMTQAAAVDKLAAFIERAEAAGKRCVLVITGKGLASGGILRDQVPRWLNQAPNRARVLAFDYAQPQHGGAGALYVLLKRRRES